MTAEGFFCYLADITVRTWAAYALLCFRLQLELISAGGFFPVKISRLLEVTQKESVHVIYITHTVFIML